MLRLSPSQSCQSRTPAVNSRQRAIIFYLLICAAHAHLSTHHFVHDHGILVYYEGCLATALPQGLDFHDCTSTKDHKLTCRRGRSASLVQRKDKGGRVRVGNRVKAHVLFLREKYSVVGLETSPSLTSPASLSRRQFSTISTAYVCL